MNKRIAQMLLTSKLVKTYLVKHPKNRQNIRRRLAKHLSVARMISRCELRNLNNNLQQHAANLVLSKKLLHCNDNWHESTAICKHANWHSSCKTKTKICTKELSQTILNYKKIKLNSNPYLPNKSEHLLRRNTCNQH